MTGQANTEKSKSALKEIFDRARLRHIADAVTSAYAHFDRDRFVAAAGEDLDSLSVMQRLRRVAVVLHDRLPQDFEAAVAILREVAPQLNSRFVTMALPEYVALYGAGHFDLSMDALQFFTRFGSSEFAVRHFLARDLQRTLAVLKTWAMDESEHVRRLASEGSRPRLPWSFRLRELVGDPSPAFPILEALKADPSDYVRKSVANHLNDISKDNPELMLDLVSAWPRDDTRTAWIVRHALRSLVKNGDSRALALLGASDIAEVEIGRFAVTPARVALGDRILISAELRSSSVARQRLVIDYAIHYVRKSGARTRKVFKLKVVELAAGASSSLAIGQDIRDFSTRRHYSGHHQVELLVNGRALASASFGLVAWVAQGRSCATELPSAQCLAPLHRLCIGQPRSRLGIYYGLPVYTIGAGRIFLWLLDRRSRGAGIAIAVRVTCRDEQEMLIELDRASYFKPLHLGRWNWIGLRLDAQRLDWTQIEQRIAASWFLAATPAQRRRLAVRPRGGLSGLEDSE